MSTMITTRAELEAMQADGDYKLANDIDLSDAPWTPLVSLASPFVGTLDGDYHVISGMNMIHDAISYNGLLAALGDLSHNGLVKNLRMTNVAMTITNNGQYTGAVAGNNRGTILNCSATGIITSCYQSGMITGYNDWLIEGCFAEGSVTTTNPYASGIAGSQSQYAVTRYCYAHVAVTGTSNAGGLLGRNSGGKLIHCFSTGKVVGTSSLGGLVGSKYTTPPQYEDTGNFWDTVTSQRSTSACGVGRITSLMRTKEIFWLAGWDFETIWQMPRSGYPRLKWETILQNRIIPAQSVYEKKTFLHGQAVSVYIK